ncbi:MAG: CAP domain-containing protein [Planctomycetota bacterium]|nr:CAP domain-containing protein [Planctomycetota bacterium]
MNRLLTSCTLSLLMWAGAARAAQDGPVQAPTKAQTLDQLQGWDLPTPAAVAFSGEVPIKDAGGSTIKARVGDDAIYYVHPMAGQRIFKVGDAWGIDTKFDDGAMGRYTYKVVKNGDGLGLASHTAQVGAFLGKPFALLDEDSNGRFNDSGADVLVYDKKLAVKLGEKFDVDGKSYKAAATASGKSVTFETYVAFDGGTASGDGGPDDTLALWNQIRASLKVPPVQRDPKLEAWAVKHMEYMNAVGGLTHPEDKNHPKFTAEGHKSGMGSCLAQGRPNARESLLGLLDSFFHRIPLIRPELEFTTVSYDPNGRFGVFDWQNGTPRKSPQWPGPLCYPPTAPRTCVRAGTAAKGRRRSPWRPLPAA